jgi:AcrR family transcriptional regulator
MAARTRGPARTRPAPTRSPRSRAAASNGAAANRTAARNGLPSAHPDGHTHGGTGRQVAEIQRARLLAGAVRAVDELGYTRAKVTDITERSRVSRRTFYELFSNYEECILALLDTTLASVRERLAAAELDALPWRERVRGGLWSILCFFDREPALARFCVVQSARGGPRMLERREQILGELAGVIDEGRGEGARGSDCPPLTAEGLMGGALSILYARLSRHEREPLTGLHGELMAMIVLPYLGPAVARREQARPAPAPSTAGATKGNGEAAPHDGGHPEGHKQAAVHGDPFQGVPMRLTYRTVRVLEAVAQRPGASNRMAGDHAGIPDQGQISKLLSRLERLGLLENTGKHRPKGEANEWRLTPAGRSVAQMVGMSIRYRGGDGFK